MSTRALFTAVGHIGRIKLSNSAKLVLIALANRHNQETGRCDPSVTRIAKDMQISERAVRDGLRELEKAKLISTVHRTVRTGQGKRNMNNRYRLTGTAKSAGGVGQDLPTKHTYNQPSAFDDLAMSICPILDGGDDA